MMRRWISWVGFALPRDLGPAVTSPIPEFKRCRPDAMAHQGFRSRGSANPTNARPDGAFRPHGDTPTRPHDPIERR